MKATQEQEIRKSLSESAKKVDQFMEKTLKDGSPELLYKASRHIIEAGGKRLRPYLTLKSCEAVGGDPELAIPFAAALEMLHNFTLIHDDLMDNDSMRRGIPTVHTKYGESMAILAGDLLFAKVYEILSNSPQDVSPDRILFTVRITSEATVTICEGQALDIGFPDTTSVSEDEYFRMVGAKTSALFKACAMVGATIGGASEEYVKALGQFAWESGIAFQIIDDVLGITADEEKLGKPVGSDIREGKKTLIIIHALDNASPPEKKVIIHALGSDEASNEDINEAINILKDLGSINYAREVAEDYRVRALKMLDVIPDNRPKDNLRAMLDYFVDREY
jgi:geranylgeranyl diphosphate synthase type I